MAASILTPEDRAEVDEIRGEHVAEESICDMMDDGWFQAHGHRGALLRIIDRLSASPWRPVTETEPARGERWLGSQFVADYICPVGSVPKGHRKPEGGYVYFVHDPGNNAVKIGYSVHDPHDRMRTLQTGHPTELVLLGYVRGPREREGELHRQFARLHLRGEWYRHGESLAKFIQAKARKK